MLRFILGYTIALMGIAIIGIVFWGAVIYGFLKFFGVEV